MQGNSAECYVETPQLEGLGVKSDATNLMGVDFQQSKVKVAPQNRLD